MAEYLANFNNTDEATSAITHLLQEWQQKRILLFNKKALIMPEQYFKIMVHHFGKMLIYIFLIASQDSFSLA